MIHVLPEQKENCCDTYIFTEKRLHLLNVSIMMVYRRRNL